MNKIIHICFSESTRGSIRHALSENLLEGSMVISFCDDLSHGPIANVEMHNRAIWWNKVLPKDEFDYIEDVKQNYKDFFQKICEIKNETVYMWYGENAYELCGLMYAILSVECNIKNLYIINVSNITYNKGLKNEYKPRYSGEIVPEKFINFIKSKTKIDEETFNNIKELWSKLQEENTLFRICENGKVISVSEDYLDEFILGYTNEKFRKAARIVGEALGYSKIHVSDTFIFWRILEMIQLGKIEYKGTFGIMREMELKQAEGIYIRNYNKLVRDNIPKIIEADGKELKFRRLEDEEYLEALDEKLHEEMMEYSLNNGSTEELADIVEVIYAILEHKNIDITEFEKIRLQKKNINGGFKEKLFLETVRKP